MIKKVKTYLNNSEIIEDENRLLDIANQFEPGKIINLSSTQSDLHMRYTYASSLSFS